MATDEEWLAEANRRKTFLERLDRICQYPRGFSRDGSLREVALWLNGYDAAVHDNSHRKFGELDFDDFRSWLSEKCYREHGWGRNYIWVWYVERLYPDNEEALRQLPILYRAFLAERGHTVPETE